jgi:hypothetical protein
MVKICINLENKGKPFGFPIIMFEFRILVGTKFMV